MNRRRRQFSTALAAAIGGLLCGGKSVTADNGIAGDKDSPSVKDRTPSKTAKTSKDSAKGGDVDLHVCKGRNDCKGKGTCSAGHSGNTCKGKNTCQGMTRCASNAARHECRGKNTCKGLGGCRLGDNGCAGKNSCEGKGGCKVPINAEHLKEK